MSTSSVTTVSAGSSTSNAPETRTRVPFPGTDGHKFVLRAKDEAMYCFIPNSVLKQGANTMDPRLFKDEEDTRRLRHMLVLFMHVCQLIGDCHAPDKRPTIMTERVLVNMRGLPQSLAITHAKGAELLQYVTEHPVSGVAGFLYTLQYAGDGRTLIKKGQNTLAEQRLDMQKLRDQVLEAIEKMGGGRAPAKMKPEKMEEVDFATYAMRSIYADMADRRNARPAALEFLKVFPDHSAIRNALYAYTGKSGYLQIPSLGVDGDYSGSDNALNPAVIFSLKNCRLEELCIHEACTNDLNRQDPVATQLCRRVNTDEARVDRFFLYRFLHAPPSRLNYAKVKAGIQTDGIILKYLKRDRAVAFPYDACFEGLTEAELRDFLYRLPTELAPEQRVAYANLVKRLQEAIFERNKGFYTGGRSSQEPLLSDTTFDDLKRENEEARAEMKRICDAFNAEHKDEELQRQHARARATAFQRRALMRLEQVFEAGRVSSAARICYRYLKEYQERHGNLYFGVLGGYMPLHKDIDSKEEKKANAECRRTEQACYDLPSFLRDAVACVGMYCSVAFNHVLIVLTFIRMFAVFLDLDIYQNVLICGPPGAGKSKVGKTVKEMMPEGVVNDLTHESNQAMAVPNGPIQDDKIQILDEFGPEFRDPESPKMRQLLATLSGAYFSSIFLELDKRTNERRSVEVRCRDRRTLMAFTNSVPEDIYPALKDRFSTYTMAPTAAQVNQLEAAAQREAQMQQNDKWVAEREVFLEKMRLITCLMCVVCKMINVGILTRPDTSAALSAYALMNLALRRRGLSLGTNRHRRAGLQLVQLCTILDAVLRVLACVPGDKRFSSVDDKDFGALLQVDPFLVAAPATEVFAVSMAHENTEPPLQSDVLDYLRDELFKGDDAENYARIRVPRRLVEKESKEAKVAVHEDNKELRYEPKPEFVEVPDKYLLRNIQVWPKKFGETPAARLAYCMSTHEKFKGKHSARAIHSVLQSLSHDTITVETEFGPRELPLLEMQNLRPEEVRGMEEKDQKTKVADAFTMATCIKHFKKDKTARPLDALREVFNNQFTTPGAYVLCASNAANPAALETTALHRDAKVKVMQCNPDFCPDPSVREAAYGLALPSTDMKIPEPRFNPTQEMLPCDSDPVRDAIAARMQRLYLPPNDRDALLRAMWNSPADVRTCAESAMREEWVPRAAVQVPANAAASSAVEEFVAEHEDRLRRQELREVRLESAKAASESKFNLNALLAGIKEPVAPLSPLRIGSEEKEENGRKRMRLEGGGHRSPSLINEDSLEVSEDELMIANRNAGDTES